MFTRWLHILTLHQYVFGKVNHPRLTQATFVQELKQAWTYILSVYIYILIYITYIYTYIYIYSFCSLQDIQQQSWAITLPCLTGTTATWTVSVDIPEIFIGLGYICSKLSTTTAYCRWLLHITTLEKTWPWPHIDPVGAPKASWCNISCNILQ